MTMDRNRWCTLCMVLVVLLTCVHCSYGQISELCEQISCQAANERCNVFKDCLFCTSTAKCVSSIPSGVEDVCLGEAYRSTVLDGDNTDPSSLTGRQCNINFGNSPLIGCPSGTTCTPDGQGGNGGICCYNKVNQNDLMETLFVNSFDYNNRTYSVFSSVYNDAMAEAVCEASGGYLAEVDDEAENDAIVAALSEQEFENVTDLLMSGTDDNANETYRFHFSNREMTYFNWSTNEPNRGSGPSCIKYNMANDNFAWDDIACTSRITFLCEIPGETHGTEGVEDDLETTSAAPTGLGVLDDDVAYDK